MKTAELKKLNIGELEDKLKELSDDLFHLKFQSATGQLENGNQIRHVRRDIAKINTLLRANDMEEIKKFGRDKYAGIVEDEAKSIKTPVGLKTRVRIALELVSSDRLKLESEIREDLTDKLHTKLVELQKELAQSVSGKENRKVKGKGRGISDTAYKSYLRLKELNKEGKISVSVKDLKQFASLEDKAPAIKEVLELKKVRNEKLAERKTLVKLEKLLRKHGQEFFAEKAK